MLSRPRPTLPFLSGDQRTLKAFIDASPRMMWGGVLLRPIRVLDSPLSVRTPAAHQVGPDVWDVMELEFAGPVGAGAPVSCLLATPRRQPWGSGGAGWV